MSTYHINPFDYFRDRDADLGYRFAWSAYRDTSFMNQSDSYTLTDALSRIAKGYEDHEPDFVALSISISDLIAGVLMKDLPDQIDGDIEQLSK